MNTNNAATAETAIIPPAPTPTGPQGAIAKPSVSFLNRSTDAALVVAINRILAGTYGNAAYPNPVPAQAAITAARDAYVQAVNTLDRGRPAQIRRNDARAAVVALLRDLALYVQHTCKGDAGVLVSSGFPVQKGRRKRVGPLDAPVNLKLLQGTLTGQLRVQCKAVPAARAYQCRYAMATLPNAWTVADPVTSSRFLLEGLTASTVYVVQVRAVGAQGASNWSEVATATVV